MMKLASELMKLSFCSKILAMVSGLVVGGSSWSAIGQVGLYICDWLVGWLVWLGRGGQVIRVHFGKRDRSLVRLVQFVQWGGPV